MILVFSAQVFCYFTWTLHTSTNEKNILVYVHYPQLKKKQNSTKNVAKDAHAGQECLLVKDHMWYLMRFLVDHKGRT